MTTADHQHSPTLLRHQQQPPAAAGKETCTHPHLHHQHRTPPHQTLAAPPNTAAAARLKIETRTQQQHQHTKPPTTKASTPSKDKPTNSVPHAAAAAAAMEKTTTTTTQHNHTTTHHHKHTQDVQLLPDGSLSPIHLLPRDQVDAWKRQQQAADTADTAAAASHQDHNNNIRKKYTKKAAIAAAAKASTHKAAAAAVTHFHINEKRCKRCNCKNSRCLKLYCECFAAGIFCDACRCINCRNTPQFSNERIAAIRATLERNADAFRPKIKLSTVVKDGKIVSVHKRGCNCRKSHCLKRYCECFQANIMCSDSCNCQNCKNTEGNPEREAAHAAQAAGGSRKRRRNNSTANATATVATTAAATTADTTHQTQTDNKKAATTTVPGGGRHSSSSNAKFKTSRSANAPAKRAAGGTANNNNSEQPTKRRARQARVRKKRRRGADAAAASATAQTTKNRRTSAPQDAANAPRAAAAKRQKKGLRSGSGGGQGNAHDTLVDTYTHHAAATGAMKEDNVDAEEEIPAGEWWGRWFSANYSAAVGAPAHEDTAAAGGVLPSPMSSAAAAAVLQQQLHPSSIAGVAAAKAAASGLRMAPLTPTKVGRRGGLRGLLGTAVGGTEKSFYSPFLRRTVPFIAVSGVSTSPLAGLVHPRLVEELTHRLILAAQRAENDASRQAARDLLGLASPQSPTNVQQEQQHRPGGLAAKRKLEPLLKSPMPTVGSGMKTGNGTHHQGDMGGKNGFEKANMNLLASTPSPQTNAMHGLLRIASGVNLGSSTTPAHLSKHLVDSIASSPSIASPQFKSPVVRGRVAPDTGMGIVMSLATPPVVGWKRGQPPRHMEVQSASALVSGPGSKSGRGVPTFDAAGILSRKSPIKSPTRPIGPAGVAKQRPITPVTAQLLCDEDENDMKDAVAPGGPSAARSTELFAAQEAAVMAEFGAFLKSWISVAQRRSGTVFSRDPLPYSAVAPQMMPDA